MKKQDLIIAFLVLIVLLLIVRRMTTSTYTSTAQLPQDIQAPVVSAIGSGDNPWMDIDTTAAPWNAGKLISVTSVPATSGGGTVDLTQVSVDNINWAMWAGSNTVSGPTQTWSLPTGVTTANVMGFRKEIKADANGNSVWGALEFLVADPAGKMTKPCTLPSIWNSATIGAVSMPDHIIFTKSAQDPGGLAQNCQITWSQPSCSSTACGTTGNNKYTVVAFTPAQYGGSCPPQKGITVTSAMVGTVQTSNEPCSAAACPTNCSATIVDAGTCTTPGCGQSAFKNFTVSNFKPAAGGGTCLPDAATGINISVNNNGTYPSTVQRCTKACPTVTGAQLGSFLGRPVADVVDPVAPKGAGDAGISAAGYTVVQNMNSPGLDIGNPRNTGDEDVCARECNNNNNCVGFVIDTATNRCYLKSGGLAAGTNTPNQNTNLYRKK